MDVPVEAGQELENLRAVVAWVPPDPAQEGDVEASRHILAAGRRASGGGGGATARAGGTFGAAGQGRRRCPRVPGARCHPERGSCRRGSSALPRRRPPARRCASPSGFAVHFGPQKILSRCTTGRPVRLDSSCASRVLPAPPGPRTTTRLARHRLRQVGPASRHWCQIIKDSTTRRGAGETRQARRQEPRSQARAGARRPRRGRLARSLRAQGDSRRPDRWTRHPPEQPDRRPLRLRLRARRPAARTRRGRSVSGASDTPALGGAPRAGAARRPARSDPPARRVEPARVGRPGRAVRR